MKQYLAVLAVCGFLTAFGASRDDGGAAHDLSGDVTVNVASGDTETWTGTISGTGKLTKTGAGKLILAADNSETFSGPIDVQDGILQMDVAGAFGTGDVTSSAACTDTKKYSVVGLAFNAADATVANNLKFTAACADWTYNFYTAKNTTFTGTISFTANCFFGDASDGSVTTVFSGPVTGASKTLQIYNRGRLEIRAPFTASNVYFYQNLASGVKSKVHFYPLAEGQSHAVNQASVKNQDIIAEGENTIFNAQWTWNSVSENADRANIDLNGYDQTVKAFGWSSGGKYGAGKVGAEIHSSRGPATLFIAGGSNGTSYFRLQDEITLVMNVAGKQQTLDNRTSETTGDLIVSNGTIRLYEEQSFPNVPRIYITSKGKVAVDCTVSGAFASATNVTVESKGQLTFSTSALTPFSGEFTALNVVSDSVVTIPDGMVVTVAELFVGGVKQPNGSYTKTDYGFLSSTGTLKVDKLVRSEATWNPSGAADDKVTTAANWGGTVPSDMTSGGLTMTVAGGTHAEVDTPMNLLGIAFADTVRGFTFDGEGPLTIGASGVTIPGDGEAHDWTFDCPIALNGPSDWTFPATDRLILSGGLIGEGAISVSSGSVEVCGENPFVGSFALNGGSLTLSGTLGLPNDQTALAQALNTYPITLSNAVVNKRFNVSPNSAGGFSLAPASTNYLNGYTSPVGGAWFPRAEADSVLIVNHTLYLDSASYQPDKNFKGTAIFNVTPYFRTTGQVIRPAAGLHIWRGASDTMGVKQFYGAYGTATNRFETDRMLKIGSQAAEQGWVGDFVFQSDNGACDLNGTVQGFTALQGTAGTLWSDTPAVVEVTPYDQKNGMKDSFFGAKVEGHVSILFGPWKGETCESLVCVLTNRAFASYGDITVTNSVLEFAADASWLNGTNVTVCGKGTLKIGASDTFGKQAVLRLADDGVLSIADGARQKVAECWVGDTKVDEGAYTYETAPEPLKSHLAATTGQLRVGRIGLMLLVR